MLFKLTLLYGTFFVMGLGSLYFLVGASKRAELRKKSLATCLIRTTYALLAIAALLVVWFSGYMAIDSMPISGSGLKWAIVHFLLSVIIPIFAAAGALLCGDRRFETNGLVSPE